MRANNRRLFETGDKRRAVVEEEGGKKLDGGMVDGGRGGEGEGEHATRVATRKVEGGGWTTRSQSRR